MQYGLTNYNSPVSPFSQPSQLTEAALIYNVKVMIMAANSIQITNLTFLQQYNNPLNVDIKNIDNPKNAVRIIL